MKCIKCGFEYNYDSKICPQCGNINTAESVNNIEQFGETVPVDNSISDNVTQPASKPPLGYDSITQFQPGYSEKKDQSNVSNNKGKKSILPFIAIGMLLIAIAVLIIVFVMKDKKDISDKSDNKSSFKIDGKLLEVNESMFGMTYEELNDYLGGTLSSLSSWEWADVPLDYCDLTYTDNNSYTLFFENKKLVGIRYETSLNGEEIPSDVYNAAVNKYGDPYKEWVSEGHGKIYEYNWKCQINGQSGEFAIFANLYNDVYHLDQQFTSSDYSGDYIQPHTMY